jgi:hypothetical protein
LLRRFTICRFRVLLLLLDVVVMEVENTACVPYFLLLLDPTVCIARLLGDLPGVPKVVCLEGDGVMTIGFAELRSFLE